MITILCGRISFSLIISKSNSKLQYPVLKLVANRGVKSIMNVPYCGFFNYIKRQGKMNFFMNERAIIDDLRRLFTGAQLSTVLFDEIRRKEQISTEPISPGEQKLTVMNYNVLAQDLINQHPYLYTNHRKEDLQWENRKRLLLKEILSMDPDILTLQEVQDSHLPTFYNQLEEYGYKGIFKRRTGNQTDGCAVYYKTSVFDLLQWTSVEYDQPGIPYLNKANVGLVLRLKFKNAPKEVIVANTHLLYNPKRWDIRLAQMQVLLTELHRITQMSETSSPALILVGDLNSRPDSPVVHLLSKGFVHTDRQILPHTLGILDNCTHAGDSKLYNRDRLFEKSNDGESCAKSEGPSSSTICINHKENRASTSTESTTKDSDLPKDTQSPSKSNYSPKAQEYLKQFPSYKDPKTLYTLKHNFNFSSVYDLNGKSKNNSATTYHDEWIIVDYIFYANLKMISRIRLPTADECAAFVRRIPNDKAPSDHFSLISTFSTV